MDPSEEGSAPVGQSDENDNDAAGKQDNSANVSDVVVVVINTTPSSDSVHKPGDNEDNDHVDSPAADEKVLIQTQEVSLQDADTPITAHTPGPGATDLPPPDSPSISLSGGERSPGSRSHGDRSSGDRSPQRAQRSQSPEELVVMEGIFEPRPSTSRDSGINRVGTTTVAAPPDPQVVPDRPLRSAAPPHNPLALKIQPRSSQYEKHPLLQIRSDSGLTEFDLMLMERDPKPSSARAMSLEEPGLAQQHQVQVLRRRLIPRAAHYERNALLEKTDSGVSPLEQYLMEKDQELAESSSQDRKALSISTTESGIGTLSESSNVSASSGDTATATLNTNLLSALLEPAPGATNKKPLLVHSKSVPESQNLPPPVAAVRSVTASLQPRQNQYEKHHLLESRDDKGMSELEHFLQEMETRYPEKGKCSTKCTCKNVNCAKCKGGGGGNTVVTTALTTTTPSPSPGPPQQVTVTEQVDMVTRIEPKTNNKRVHFQRQECVELTPERDKDTDNKDGDNTESPSETAGEVAETDVSSHGDDSGGNSSNSKASTPPPPSNNNKRPKKAKSRCTLS